MSTFTNIELSCAIANTDAALRRVAFESTAYGISSTDPAMIALADQLTEHHKTLLAEEARRAVRDSVAAAVAQDAQGAAVAVASQIASEVMSTVGSQPDPNKLIAYVLEIHDTAAVNSLPSLSSTNTLSQIRKTFSRIGECATAAHGILLARQSSLRGARHELQCARDSLSALPALHPARTHLSSLVSHLDRLAP